MAPLQIDRGMSPFCVPGPAFANAAHGRFAPLVQPKIRRRDVVAEALVGPAGAASGARPLAEVDPRDEPRLHEARELRRLRAGERAVVARQRLQQPPSRTSSASVKPVPTRPA